MAGNSFGQHFRVTTFGESHGLAIGGIIDGCPPGLPLQESDLQPDLDRRRPGRTRYTTQRREADEVKILSGTFEGKTTGTPIAVIIENTDQRSQDYRGIAEQFRPGHADYTYAHKYGIRDHRGGGRSSARETAIRVAAGAIAKKWLATQYHIHIQGFVTQIGSIIAEQIVPDQVDHNDFYFADPNKIPALDALLREIKKAGDSIGARVMVQATGVPVGLGEPIFDRLDADLAHALMSINAVKGIEIGSGFNTVTQKGSEHRDEMTATNFLSNHAGGILGGISTGQPITAQLALKPTSSISIPGKTINQQGAEETIITKGRHDPCVGIRAVPIAEAMMAICLMDHALRHRGQNQDILPTTHRII